MTEISPPRAEPALNLVILAAGKGTRMASSRAKVLHEIGGLSLIGHALAGARPLSPGRVAVVVGHDGDSVAAEAARLWPGVATARQEEQLGTGHAVLQAREVLEGATGDVLVLYGDSPFVSTGTLRRLIAARRAGAAVGVLGFEPEEPGGYGRLKLAPDGGLDAIVEAKDATPEEAAIRLCNSGVLIFPAERLFGWLDRLSPANAKGEYYLTDVVALARAEGLPCAAVRASAEEVLGVNSRLELAGAEALFQQERRRAVLESGVTMTAPETVFFSHDTRIEPDVLIEPHVVFGPGVHVRGGARIRAFSHLEGAEVASGAIVGPYARLRPGTQVGEGAHVGNFVELKNARLGAGAKANHLAYLGDAAVGAGTNVGAGVITANYDGVSKHRTEIGEGAFIGSNAVLIAPIRVGDGALVAAGSTVLKDIPAEALSVARADQRILPGAAARLRARLRAGRTPKS
ncbi:bifunctional UDP-N-acetylglucosamine diphosphorylase/glucosamine-1-phosphate N-acetyltransferase GlmU [Neomegalonema sp.]|uniref:bifunctional UDP-N-acetylglucosamine diphosphorylase/glucosamine-1-phosphate N-acetyltransferase GlmU n=1 Tax=Neomegalonema sp. TaxID=2039713 RepID=UPI002637B250|nr:bifunctional UDP-N-acetylglucosamine diphosphorylase/glucosamine-1-phosphate N-acetyltransferase GlmU [Neomegalonema sp.]MDD2869931.1 bifunctional UDP-N-acetylglucosamine diphosphorylase/glucosamine-1-phosphate N-acetyltransferase GlmU [Neomegalonema sp.]